MNITNMFFPNEGQDIAEVGVKQGDVLPGEIKSVMEIEGTGSGMYDFNNTAHRQLERIGANQFNQLFFSTLTGKHVFVTCSCLLPSCSLSQRPKVATTRFQTGHTTKCARVRIMYHVSKLRMFSNLALFF